MTDLIRYNQPPFYVPETDFVSVDLLRSQLLLLSTIASCATQHWATHNTKERAKRHPDGPSALPRLPLLFQDEVRDPPPLSDFVAQQLVNLCTFFLKQHILHDDGLSSGNSSTQESSETILIPTLARNALKAAEKGLQVSTVVVDSSPVGNPTRQSVAFDIYKMAGMITYYVSASNWNVIFSRLKSRLGHYANSDEAPELGEMRILEWSCLDRKRLSTVIQGEFRTISKKRGGVDLPLRQCRTLQHLHSSQATSSSFHVSHPPSCDLVLDRISRR